MEEPVAEFSWVFRVGVESLLQNPVPVTIAVQVNINIPSWSSKV